MTKEPLPRLWPPSHWATKRRLKDPAEALWAEMRWARGEIDYITLVRCALAHCGEKFALLGEASRAFDDILDDWVAREIVEAEGRRTRYRIVRKYLFLRSPPPAPNRQPPTIKRTQRQRLWSAMRVLRSFDLPTLLMASGASRRSAIELLGLLERAGWLRRVGNGWTLSGDRKWGPIAPIVSRAADHVRLIDPVTRDITEINASRGQRARHSSSSTGAQVGGGVS